MWGDSTSGAHMADELVNSPQYLSTMERLEAVKRSTVEGADYWLARDINAILGYPNWREFEDVIDRARSAFDGNGIDSSHQIVLTHKMMEVARGAQRRGDDYFLSRSACYLIAMNGDPTKPEIAAAQAYFAVQTRRMEIADQAAELSDDEKRLELRGKVAQSFKIVSGVAQDAGVSGRMQAIFHDARYHGLYGMSGRDVKRRKGLRDKDNIFDYAGPLELSANDFQMNLAAEVIRNDRVSGEQQVIKTNKAVGVRVRKAIADSGATLPENLPLDEPIKEVRKRVGAAKRLPPNRPSS